MRLPDPSERDRGFTLIEILVVVIIIGILSGVAIPVFLHQRDKAARASTRANMRNAINEIMLAREGAQKPLIQVTGSNYSLGQCLPQPTKIRVTDPGFGTSQCGAHWLTITSRIAAASGSDVTAVRAVFTDGWGVPIVMDENEAESQFGCNTADALISAGPTGMWNSTTKIGMGVPLGGFCQ